MTRQEKLAQERKGIQVLTRYGERATVEAYHSSCEVDIIFENGERATVKWYDFNKGQVRNAYTPTVLGKGYMGKGAYNRKTHLKEYEMWVHMLERCYSPLLKERAPGYEGVTCCDRWLNFQYFCEDIHAYGQDIYDKDAKYELDKDLLVPGNKIYCPERCCLLPTELNCILTQATRSRGDLPIGVFIDYDRGVYRARISKKNHSYNSGQRFKTPEEAFAWYKREKESYVRERADAWSEKLDPGVVDALFKWEVHITD